MPVCVLNIALEGTGGTDTTTLVITYRYMYWVHIFTTTRRLEALAFQ